MIKIFEDFNRNNPFNKDEYMLLKIYDNNSIEHFLLMKVIAILPNKTIGGEIGGIRSRILYSATIQTFFNSQTLDIYYNMVEGDYSNYFGDKTYKLMWRGYSEVEALEYYKNIKLENKYNI
jgi:hypothetical protein